MLAHADIDLPETFHFLGLGWWAVHLAAIPLFLVIGYLLGKRKPIQEEPMEYPDQRRDET